ncbi:unnamed protein product [Rotaria sp. Silwood2]|nr:unnamed protein product [Rotaria sp. Silwood2]CAF3973369.1 unnamed protein product [Rotaria sp. Silwood2]CAF4282783.1 unnamed protein product [Rotaria sp. Silwood2]
MKLYSPFGDHSTAQSVLKGNVITFMQNVPNIVSSLPLKADDLCDTIKIIFIGAHKPDRQQLRKICGVNKQKVRNALLWLKKHNYLYQKIPINEANIDSLPDDDVPESLWNTIDTLEDISNAETERSGLSNEVLDNTDELSGQNESSIITLSTSAVLDVNGTTITTKDISEHLVHKINANTEKPQVEVLNNIVEDEDENEDVVYLIPRSAIPANEILNQELILGLFPTLFPYGYGAPHDLSRPVSVSLKQHIQYLLRYSDHRFEKHHSFIFVLFNMMQRQQACYNASLMASRPYFRSIASDLETLTSKEIEIALNNISKDKFSCVTDSRIKMLMNQIRTVGGHVMGSTYSRSNLRTQIHALIYSQGLPSIFITINPADIHSRVALYFAGVDLDLDKILPETIPSTFERAQIIASHPVATAHFFNVLISSILDNLIMKGVLGPMKAYFGTVESQGRGSLHLHMLLWLDHDITPSQMKEKIQNEEFRKSFINYLEDIIKEDLSMFIPDGSNINDLEQQQASLGHNYQSDSVNVDSREQMSNKNSFDNEATSLPPAMMLTPNPALPNFPSVFKRDVVQLVNSGNIHHHTGSCYKYSKKRDNPECRVHMPRKIVKESTIDTQSGEVKLKRLHETINNFNEYIITACRSNMDIKYIFSGSDSKALVYYITDYVTKSNLSFYDTFSLMLKATQYLEKRATQANNILSAEEKSRKLVLRCYNTLASQQELSGVQVASYLMSWPDHYTTHEFANIFLIGIEHYLQATLEEEKVKQQCLVEDTINNENDEENYAEFEEQFTLQLVESINEYVYVNGRLDYQYRSKSLDALCLYDYVRLYRKKLIDAYDKKQLQARTTAETIESTDLRRGRPPCERVLFEVPHPQVSSHLNIKRTKPVVPVLLGPAIPRRDRDDTKERYYRSILTLFVPWRSVADLCSINQTWEQAFEVHEKTITAESHKIIENIQLLHECKKDRDEHLKQVIEAIQTETIYHHFYPSEMEDDNVEDNDAVLDVLENLYINDLYSPKNIGIGAEENYFRKIVQNIDRIDRFIHIKGVGPTKNLIYTRKSDKLIFEDKKHLIPLTDELMKLSYRWQRKINDEKERRRNIYMNEEDNSVEIEQTDKEDDQLFIKPVEDSLLHYNASASLSLESIQPVSTMIVINSYSQEQIALEFTLNKNQKAAFMIITSHLNANDETSSNGKQEQLIMCVPGCGGTGKSQLIRAITAYFDQTKRARKLRKLAPTSVAAAEIDGMTIHSFLGESRNPKARLKLRTRPGQTTLENKWRFVEYLIIDEMSMVGLSLLARLSRVIATAKHSDPTLPMGGINIIFFGDYMQYSPVFDKPLYHECLPVKINKAGAGNKLPTETDIQQKSARAIILQINCVVVLEEQIRTKDPVYRDLLNRVRQGEGTYEDWLLLRTRVIGIGLQVSLNDPPWNEAPILVYRNEVRTELNNRAVINKAYEVGQSPTVVVAQDTIKTKKNIDLPHLTKQLLTLPDNKTKHLPGYLPLVPGMPVLLQENIACELGLSNGTPGIFRKLIYDETSGHTTGLEESLFTPDTLFVRNAQYALIEIRNSRIDQLESLESSIIPIPVIEKTFDVDLKKLYANQSSILKSLNDQKIKATINVKRRGLPLIPAYAITTHKSQGQTLSKIAIDLNMPPGIVEVASAYVPLSRVQRLDDLVILQDFPINALQVKPSKAQIDEISRLHDLFKQTKEKYARYFY